MLVTSCNYISKCILAKSTIGSPANWQTILNVIQHDEEYSTGNTGNLGAEKKWGRPALSYRYCHVNLAETRTTGHLMGKMKHFWCPVCNKK